MIPLAPLMGEAPGGCNFHRKTERVDVHGKKHSTIGSAKKEALDAYPETSTLSNGPLRDEEFL